MKIDNYIKKKVVLTGYGLVEEMKLDRQFFEEQEQKHGKIEGVYPIGQSRGGNAMRDAASDGDAIKGCLISFIDGKEIIFESDGEYIDWFLIDKKEGEERKCSVKKK